MSGEAKTVLVVDDEEALRQLISMTLALDGYHVLEAANYEEAISASDDLHGTLDLLVTDVLLPGRSGYDIAAGLSAVWPNLKVLYISGSAGVEVLNMTGGPMERSAFLAKPFHPSQLREGLSRLLGDYAHASAGSSIPRPGTRN